MEEYALKTKDGDVIKKLKANDISIATNMFAQMKNLSEVELLEIFIVELVS